MKIPVWRPHFFLASLLPLYCSMALGQAVDENSYGLNVGLGHSDNIKRTQIDKTAETIATVGTDFKFRKDARLLKVDASGAVEYFNFLNNAYSPQLLAGLAGAARLEFVPDRLSWILRDNFGQKPQVEFAAYTPDNQEFINYLTTGPDIVLPLGNRTRLDLNGGYSIVTYQRSPLDESRYTGQLELERLLSAASSIAVVGNTETVKFKDKSVAEDYRRNEYYLRYKIAGTRTSLDINVGSTNLKIGEQSNSGELGRLQVSRVILPGMDVKLQVGREFSDGANTLRQLQGTFGPTVADIPLQSTSDPYRSDYAELNCDFTRNRTAFSLTASEHKESHSQRTDLDRVWWLGTAELQRQFAPAVVGYLAANYRTQKYDVRGTKSSEASGLVGLNYQLSTHLFLDLRYENFRRSSQTDLALYRENQIWLRIAYRKGSARFAY